jgi:hypothetical protein
MAGKVHSQISELVGEKKGVKSALGSSFKLHFVKKWQAMNMRCRDEFSSTVFLSASSRRV